MSARGDRGAEVRLTTPHPAWYLRETQRGQESVRDNDWRPGGPMTEKGDAAAEGQVQHRAVLLLADRHIVTRLRQTGARSPEAAQPLSRLGRLGPVRRARLRRLIAAGAVREAGSGAYYLDEAAYETWCVEERARFRERARRAAYTTVVLVVALAVLLLMI